ncbi:MAG: hypothetical protein GY943_35085 [Chloroflexi bacterium]|nr:hypothetical protein [Chloroflexota bacterium]
MTPGVQAALVLASEFELFVILLSNGFHLPYLNRFLSADSIVPNPTSPQSFNRYSYTRNNPVNRIDPSGHSECGVGQYHCPGDTPVTLMDPALLGFHSGNTDPLVLEFYRNPYQFTGEAGVEYYASGVSPAANSLTPLIGQGQIPDVPGNPMEGYFPSFSIHDWDADGIPEWDRFVTTPDGLSPVFQAEWEVRSVGGHNITVETFPLAGNNDVTASVYLEPIVSPGSSGPVRFVSTQVEITVAGVGSQMITFPTGTYIEFVTQQTGPATIETVGGLVVDGNKVGTVIYEMSYTPHIHNQSPYTPGYEVP